jgi:uncharacterized protein (UPF0335 family)
MNRAFRVVIRRAVGVVVTYSVSFCVTTHAFAQTADEPNKLRGAIDDEESGILGADIAASDNLVDAAENAMTDEAKRDLGIASKPSQNPQFFVPQKTPPSLEAPVKPTIDSSLKSIADEIEVLEEEGRQLQQTPAVEPLTAKPTVDSSLESIAEEIQLLEEEAKKLN